MRGAHGEAYGVNDLKRIIPAYAGSTVIRKAPSMRCRDHPRVCGEHGTRYQGKAFFSGSSPRMRGALIARGGTIQIPRIIPAYAGSTYGWPYGVDLSEDHPRVCGEHRVSYLD